MNRSEATLVADVLTQRAANATARQHRAEELGNRKQAAYSEAEAKLFISAAQIIRDALTETEKQRLYLEAREREDNMGSDA